MIECLLKMHGKCCFTSKSPAFRRRQCISLIEIISSLSVFYLPIITMFTLVLLSGCSTNTNVKFRNNEIFETELINKALNELQYEGYNPNYTDNREGILTKFAQYLYSQNDTGVENVRFKYYLSLYLDDKKLSEDEFKELIEILVDTEKYINDFDIDEYMYIGCNYSDKRYSADKIGKQVEEIDNIYDYDYDLVEKLYSQYNTIDRKRALSGIFYKVVGDEIENTKRQELVVDFLAKGIFHNPLYQPSSRGGQLIYDPVVLLELHEMRCGNINRIACDLFDSVGYQTRVVQLAGHVIGEIYYNGNWHYFDADTILNSDSIVRIDNEIPPINELSLNPYLIDKMDFYFDKCLYPYNSFGYNNKLYDHFLSYPSYIYFNFNNTETIPLYYYKTSTDIQALNEYYGWNYNNTIENNDLKTIDYFYYQPSMPIINKVTITDSNIHIEFESEDIDNDLQGYEIYVSKYSRGWEYYDHYCDEPVDQYVLNKYSPEQYDYINEMPPSEILFAKTKNNYYDLNLNKGTYYITIMAYDKHGEEIGKAWYNPSNELTIVIKQ